MKERFPIFIDAPSIITIAENHFRNFEFIFKNRAVVYLDMTECEIDDFETITGNTNISDLALYFNEIDVLPRSGKSVFESILSCNGYSFSNEFLGCVFILDITKEEANTLGEESGVWIIAKEEIEKDSDVESLILDEIHMEDEDVAPQVQFGSHSENGWIGLLDDRITKFPPFGEIILYDNFLKEFSKEYLKTPPYMKKKVNGKTFPYSYIGLENLLLLFDAILPKKHLNPFKILIVLPKNTNIEHEIKLENRIKVWIDEAKKIRDYTINVTFLLIGNSKWKEDDRESHPLHPRVLYTNYFMIETGKGFKIFEPYPDSNVVRKDGDSKNSISLTSFFSTPKMRSNPIKVNYNSKLGDIGKQLESVSCDVVNSNNNIIGIKTGTDSFSLFDNIVFE